MIRLLSPGDAVSSAPCFRLCGISPFAVMGLAIGLAGLPLSTSAQAAELTLQAALEAARARSTALPAQQAAARAAQQLAISAGSLPDPQLRLSLDSVPVEGPLQYSLNDDFMTKQSVGISQTFTGSDKRQARGERYRREAEAAMTMRSLQQARLYTSTATAWFERYFQQQALELLQQQLDEAMGISSAVEAAWRGGRSSQSDVLLAHAAVARIKDRMHQTRADLASAEALLERWVGADAQLPLGPLPRLDQTDLEHHVLAEHIEQHPGIALLDARERVALADAEVARQELSADWTWSLQYSYRQQFSDQVSLGVSVPLQWNQSQRQGRELSARWEQVEQLRLEREELLRAHLYEVQHLLENWRSGLARLEDYDRTLIPLVTANVAAKEAGFSSGEALLSEVLEARRMLIDTRLERLRIEQQTAQWWAEMEFLLLEDAQQGQESVS